MALPSDDAATALQGIKQKPAELELAAETTVPVAPGAGMEEPIPDVLAPPAETSLVEPVQVAGLFDTVANAVRSRVQRAEKNVLPPLKDQPVQMIGDNKALLVRPLEQSEIDNLSQVIGGQYTKGINLPRLAEGMNDTNLADYLARLKDANKDLFEEARRGTLNFDELLKRADAKDIDNVIWDWMKKSPGSTANAEDVLAGLLASVALTKETQGAFLKAFATADPVAREAAMKRAAQYMAMEAELYAKVSGAGSEAGRTLYMLSQSQKMAGVNMAERSDQLIKLFGSESVQDIEFIGQAYLSMSNPRARAEFVKQGLVAKSMDMLAEVYVNSLLSAPPTHIVNVMGNATFMATKVLETAVAGGIGRVRSAITGNADRVYASEALAQINGIRSGFADALLVSGKSLITEEASDIGSKIDLRTRRAIGTTGNPAEIYDEFRNGNYMAGAVNVLGVSARVGGRFLLAEDEFFKAVGYRMFLHGEAQRAASRMYDEVIAQGKTAADALAAANIERNRILTDPPQSVIKTARDAAKEMTFQKDLEGALGGAQEALSHPIAKLFVPFFKTPTNIAGAILERSPVQLLNPGFYRTIAAGGREADIAMAKLATGSMIMGTFAYTSMGLDNDGAVIINGAGPTEPTARQAWLRKGFLPYSISVKMEDGTYKSVTYNRFDPISGVLGMGADFAYYAMHEKDGNVLGDLATAGGMSVMNYMMEQPMVSGLKEIFAAINLPNPRDRFDKLQQLFAEKLTTGGLSFVPGTGAFSAGVSRMNDPTQKNVMLPETGLMGEDPTELPEFMKGFYIALQKAKRANPYFNKDLPPQLNEWAEPMTVGDGTAWDFLSPVKIKDSKFAPVDDEILRLGGGFQPTKKKLDGVDLNALQYNRLIELTNQFDAMGRLPGTKGYDASATLLGTLSELIGTKEYRALPTNEDKQTAISNVVGMFRKAARQQLLKEDPYLAAKIAAQP